MFLRLKSAQLLLITALLMCLSFSYPGWAGAEETSDSFFDFHGSIGSADEGKFETYAPAVSSPLMNETPYITTEARPIFWFHKIPKKSIVGNGEVFLAALQARIALTERLGFIATKDGYAWINTKKTLEDENGFANIAVGLKYALLYKPEDRFILTTGVKYEAPSGHLKLNNVYFQGSGKGLMDLFLSSEKRWDKLGIEGSFGWTIPFDTVRQSGLVHYHFHADYELFKNFFPLFEYNGYTVANKGRERSLDFEGVDVFNLGNDGGGTVSTLAVGFRYRFTNHIQLGTAWEWAVGGREDLIDYRYQCDLIISF